VVVQTFLKHEAESHQATKASHAEVNANLVAANSDLANSKRELKEVRDENSAIKREQQAAQAQLLQINERVDMLTHTNGILSTQLQLLLNRIRGVCPDIADEFVLDAHQTRKSEAV
jgi:chromosome segregation ATPase